MIQLQHRLAKLEHRSAVEEADSLLVIVRSYRRADDPTVDADLDLDSGDIEGLTDRERQFLAGRRRNT